MKKRINNYTFDASERTVTLTGITVDIDSLLLITNLADNIIIFNFADSTKTATAAGSVITLAYDTTSMGDSDPLQIFYDDSVSYPLTNDELRLTALPVSVEGAATEAQQLALASDVAGLLTELQQKTEPDNEQSVWDSPSYNMLIRILEQVSVPVWYDPAANTLRVGTHAVTQSGTSWTVSACTVSATSGTIVNVGQDISAESWTICIRNLLT